MNIKSTLNQTLSKQKEYSLEWSRRALVESKEKIRALANLLYSTTCTTLFIT